MWAVVVVGPGGAGIRRSNKKIERREDIASRRRNGRQLAEAAEAEGGTPTRDVERKNEQDRWLSEGRDV